MMQQQMQFYSIFSNETCIYKSTFLEIVSSIYKFAHCYHIICKYIFVQQINIEIL